MELKLIEIAIEDLGKNGDPITQIKNLTKQIDSSNINILLGAGFSCSVLGLLGNHEKEMAIAVESENEDNLYKTQKDFFDKIIHPLLDETKIKEEEDKRMNFFSLINNIIQNRKSSILHKIVNIFTTNYDLLIEYALERRKSEYIDGFSGKIRPIFSTANYGKIINRQTSISSMTSEIVTFNLYKVHGSLNWRCEKNEIVHSDHITTIGELNDIKDNKSQFLEDYKNKLAIINPTKEKLNATVLNVNYYDQLRMFCNELEKNNTILISYGFSFDDEHIRQMTLRALKSNPTLTLIILSYDGKSTEKFEKHFEECSNVNIIQIVKREDGKTEIMPFSQDNVNKIFAEICNGIK